MTEEDDACLDRMLSGDEAAFRTVFRAVQPGLVRYLVVLVGVADAEDVAADAWAEAVRDLGKFRGGMDGFRGWITTIARHRGLDLLRRQARRPVADSDVYALDTHEPLAAAETEAMALFSTEEALRLIASLSPDQAEAVLLRAVIGLDARSAAHVLGKRPGAVRTAAHRGLKALARKLSEDRSDVLHRPDADITR